MMSREKIVPSDCSSEELRREEDSPVFIDKK